MRKQEKILVLDFLTLVIAVLSLSLIISAWATMLKPADVTDKLFRELFGLAIVSFGITYLLLHAIKYLLSFKISFTNLPFNFLWFLTITSGTFLFTYFSFESKLFGSFKGFFGFLMVAMIPSALFRFTVNFVISYWEERKDPAKLSIVR